MYAETEFLRKYLKFIILQIVVWGIPLLWIMLIPPKDRALDAESINDQNVARTHKIIAVFEKEYRTLPDSMTELKAYARARRFRSEFYDAYGNPLEYILLSENNYIVRSFGRDGDQNTLLQDHDNAGSRLKQTPRETPQYEYTVGPSLSVYPAVLISGSNSPQKQWFARIFVNYKDGKRRLAVYHKKKRAFFMVAHHDSVEEFLWLPSGYALIYSASSSQRYRDGVFYWDLLEDEQVNLLTSGSFDVNMTLPSGTTNEFMVSLAGLDMDGSKVYFYLVNKKYGEALSPYDFYSTEALVAATIPINIDEKITLSQAIPDQSATIFDLEFERPTISSSDSLSLREQHEWMSLKLSGNIYELIDKWQDFVERYPQSALTPYALYHITNLYHTAYSQNTSQSDSELAQIRGYAAEMAKALAEHPLAPSYLKALGKHSYNQIIQGDPIVYNLDVLK